MCSVWERPGLKQQEISLQFDAIVARLPLTDPSTVQPAILAKLFSINTKSCETSVTKAKKHTNIK